MQNRESTEQPKKKGFVNSRSTKCDYAWVPAWGLVTASTIQQLNDAGTKEFKLKDGSIIHFCNLDDAPKHSLQWVIDNPGIFSS